MDDQLIRLDYIPKGSPFCVRYCSKINQTDYAIIGHHTLTVTFETKSANIQISWALLNSPLSNAYKLLKKPYYYIASRKSTLLFLK